MCAGGEKKRVYAVSTGKNNGGKLRTVHLSPREIITDFLFSGVKDDTTIESWWVGWLGCWKVLCPVEDVAGGEMGDECRKDF